MSTITRSRMGRALVAAAMLSAATVVFAEQRYHDPGGRYSLPVPDGWQVAEQRSGVSLVNGPAYVSLMKVEGRGTSRGLVEAVGVRITNQWQGFDNANAARCKLAGREGFCAWYSGTNPKGVEAVLRMGGVAADGWGYVLFMSAPREAFAENKAVFAGIERGFRLEGGS